MNIAVIRRKFPEYGDLADADLLEVFANMLQEVMTEPPAKYAERVHDPSVEAAIQDVVKAIDGFNVDSVLELMGKLSGKLDSINAGIYASNKAIKDIKLEDGKDISPYFEMLARQLSKVETAILSNKVSMPEIVIPANKTVSSFKVKRDEFGYIKEVIPVY